MSILIKNVNLAGIRQDISIKDNHIDAIGKNLSGNYDTILDGSCRIAVPGFYNTHTHAAMSLLRGYADDMELFEWLSQHIWPAEQKLDENAIYWGTRLACLEMIKTGTVGFCDMYFWPWHVAKAADDAGIRAAVGGTTLTASPSAAMYHQQILEAWERRSEFSSLIQFIRAPHAVYTCTPEAIQECAEFAAKENIRLTLHVSETAQEVQDCKAAHNGMTPVAYLDSLGVLNSHTIAAHCIHLTAEDMAIFAERGVYASFNPCSNLKLCSGLFQFRKMLDCGCKVAIGTDGNASNNNLSMFDEMKTAAFVAKLATGGPTGCNAGEIYHAATQTGAEALGIDAGTIQVGALADMLLLDSNSTLLTPDHNLVSNLVYSADSSCVQTVICNGRILMQDRVVEGEEEVLAKASECAARLRG